MLLALVVINTFIFVALSSIHFYWLAGGRWGLDMALPTNPSQDFLFRPSTMATLVVAFGLLLFAIITLGNGFAFQGKVDQHYFRYGDGVISLIFLMRAVGDFRYVGFFKRIRETTFAKMDSRFYSPLCLLVAMIGSMIFFLTIRTS